eukprot:2440540-Rhodomonas_salina.1
MYPNSWLLLSERKPDLWTYDSQTLYFVPSGKTLANPTTTPKPVAPLRQPRIVSQDTSGQLTASSFYSACCSYLKSGCGHKEVVDFADVTRTTLVELSSLSSSEHSDQNWASLLVEQCCMSIPGNQCMGVQCQCGRTLLISTHFFPGLGASSQVDWALFVAENARRPEKG